MKGQEAKCPPNKKPKKKKNVAKRHSPNKQEAKKKKHGFTEHEFNALPHRTCQRTALVFCLAAQRITTAFCSIFPMEFLGIRLLHGWFFSQRPPSLEANNGAIQMLRRARDFSWKRSVGKKKHTHTHKPLCRHECGAQACSLATLSGLFSHCVFDLLPFRHIRSLLCCTSDFFVSDLRFC